VGKYISLYTIQILRNRSHDAEVAGRGGRTVQRETLTVTIIRIGKLIATVINIGTHTVTVILIYRFSVTLKHLGKLTVNVIHTFTLTVTFIYTGKLNFTVIHT